MEHPTKHRALRRHAAPRARTWFAVVATCVALFATSCKTDSPTGPAALATITVTPNLSMAVNSTQQFSAVGRDANGNTLVITPVWSVVAGGGSIGIDGLFTSGATVGIYTNTVRATVGGISGYASVTETSAAPVLASITIDPAAPSVVVGGTQQFAAVGKDAGGNVIAIAPIWAVVAGGGGIDNMGVFTAGPTAGTYTNTIRASSGAISGSASVVVTLVPPPPPLATITIVPNSSTLAYGATQQFAAVGRDANGNIMAISPVWSVVASGGSVNSSGMFTAGSTAGTFSNTVKATSGSISGFASIVVTAVVPPPLATITITPNPATLSGNATQQFTAVGKDANGNVMSITPSWSVVAGGGSIASGGLFTAGSVAGTFSNTVVATSGSISGSASVTVTIAPVLTTITLAPTSSTLAGGATQQFTAAGHDQNGNLMAIAPVWSVVAGGGSIASGGLFTAGSVAGTFTNTVVATSGSISGSASVTVTIVAPVLTTITVSPATITLAGGATQQYSAVGKDQNGAVMSITPVWSVLAGGGTISSGGLFTAGSVAGTFSNTVEAASGSISGTASVTVTVVSPPPLIDLGVAAPFAILAASTVTCVDLGTVTGDVGLYAGTAMTGFPPCIISGVQHITDPTAQAAQGANQTAYLQLAGMACGTTLTTDLGGLTLAPGVYCTAAAQGLTGQMFFDAQGDPNAVFVIQVGAALTTAAAQVTLLNGAQAKNIYWQVGSSATLGTGSVMSGNILALASITLNDNSTLVGRALAQTAAVTLGTSNTIALP